MTDEQIKEGLKNLTEEQKEIINEYCVDEMKELKKISHFAWERFGLPFSVRDDLYSDALKVLMESILTYDGSRGANFKTFLSNNIKLSASEWYRDNYLRSKRNNLKLDVNGNIERDENGNPIIVQNLSFDAPTVLNDDEMDLKEKIPAPEVSKENVSINLQNYLDTLSEMESTIALYILDGYKLKEIKDILHISDKQLERYKRNMSTFERYRLLKHDDYVGKEMEDKEMSVGYTTLEKSKPDRQSIASIIKKINNLTFRFDHPLQRQSDQWTNVMKGNLVSDILQGNPIPQLVFAEQIINSIAIIWDLDGKQRCLTSYDFYNNKFKISKNIRRSLISYQRILKDEKGSPVLDENGFPITVREEFDIKNKNFSDLPEELQDKFLDYNFEIVQYLNCSPEDIAYHYARYNEGKPMNTSQKGVICLGEQFATLVKGIAAMPFFKEMGNYSSRQANNINGAMDRVVVESIMTTNFLDDWNKENEKMCEFLKENATEETFNNFEDMVMRLSEIADESTLEKFNVKDSMVWFGLFGRFINTGLDDEKFVEFVAEFSQSLHSKKVNDISYDDIVENSKSTKDKSVIVSKIETLEHLMKEYFDIEENDNEVIYDGIGCDAANSEIENLNIVNDGKEDIKSLEDEVNSESIMDVDMKANGEDINAGDTVSTIDFVKENVTENVNEEDIEFYKDMVDDCVKVDSPVYVSCKTALIALMAYACQNETDEKFEKWIEQYKYQTNFSRSQKVNYMYMKNNFDKMCREEG